MNSFDKSPDMPREVLDWQVELRRHTMEERAGAPHAGVCPLVTVRHGRGAADFTSWSIVCGLLPAQPVLYEKTKEFRQLYEDHQGLGARALYDAGLEYLKPYYDDASSFDGASITTLLSKDTPVVDALRATPDCALVFYVPDLTERREVLKFRCMHMETRAYVLESGAVYDNVWWHNTLFHGMAEDHVVVHFRHRKTWDTRFGHLEAMHA